MKDEGCNACNTAADPAVVKEAGIDAVRVLAAFKDLPADYHHNVDNVDNVVIEGCINLCNIYVAVAVKNGTVVAGSSTVAVEKELADYLEDIFDVESVEKKF